MRDRQVKRLSITSKEGKFFGPRKAFVKSSFNLVKWAVKMGYSQEKLEELNDRGVLKKILRYGKKGTGFKWHDKETGWTRLESKRTGALAQKVGMSSEIDWWGGIHPVTILHLPDNVVCV